MQMSEAQIIQYQQAIAAGKHRILMSYLIKGIDLPVSSDQLLRIIKSKNEKLMMVIVSECENIEITADVISGCIKNKWKKVLTKLVSRSDCKVDDLTNNERLIQILSLKDFDLSRQVLSSKKIDFNGPNADVLIYLCKENNVTLVKHIMYTTYIDPNYDNNIFIKAAIRKNSQGVIQLFKKFGGYEESPEMLMFEYLRSTRSGI